MYEYKQGIVIAETVYRAECPYCVFATDIAPISEDDGGAYFEDLIVRCLCCHRDFEVTTCAGGM